MKVPKSMGRQTGPLPQNKPKSEKTAYPDATSAFFILALHRPYTLSLAEFDVPLNHLSTLLPALVLWVTITEVLWVQVLGLE